MKSIVVLIALTFTFGVFADEVLEEVSYISTQKYEKFISVEDLTLSDNGFIFKYKVSEPSSFFDENGVKHGGRYSFSIIKNPGISGIACVRLSTESAQRYIRSCTTGPEPVCTTRTTALPIERYAEGYAKVLNSDLVHTSENLNSDTCFILPLE